jgi:hypothetical protein
VDSPCLDFHGFLYFGFGFQSSSRYSHILNVAISLHSRTRNIYACVIFVYKNIKEKVCVRVRHIESTVLLLSFVCIVCDTGTLRAVLHTQVLVA